jgi:hypothetical protein
MNTLENNKIIAQFMGLAPRLVSPDVYEYSDSPFISIRKDNPEKVMDGIVKYAKYNTDWNWLMPVVEKIQLIPSYDRDKFGTIVKIEGRNCSIKSGNYGLKDRDYSKNIYFNANYDGDTKIQAVYNACLAYINWHNQNRK